jgi:twinkle protein
VVKDRPPVKPLGIDDLRWLREERGISQATAEKHGVYASHTYFRKLGHSAPALAFPFFDQGQMYASKLRCLQEKDFSCSGSPKSFFGLSEVGTLDRLFIVEGEMDVLAFTEAGIENAVSVPNGAPNKTSNGYLPQGDQRLQCLSRAKEILDEVDEVYIAGDQDPQGNILTEELARRIGKHRCWRVTWPDDCKDANDVLLKHGAEKIRECVEAAEPFPVAGLYSASTFYGDVLNLYKEGKGKGISTGYLGIDDLYTIVPGYMSVVTGIPSSGKSEFIDQLMVNLSLREGWTHAVCSFENEPRYHITKLVQKYARKHFFDGPSERLGSGELQQALAWVNRHFTFLYQADGSMADIDSIIDRLKVAVVRHGIRGAVLDPMNYIDRPRDANETQWVSDVLTKLKLFVQAHDVHLWLVAHPTKMHRRDDGRIPVPTGYDISGSSHFFNKADFGWTIHRSPDEPALVEFHSWKARMSWAGKQGMSTLLYDAATTAYADKTATEVGQWYDD